MGGGALRVAAAHCIARIDAREQRRDEPGPVALIRHRVADPLALPHAAQQARVAQHLEMARYARLALADRCRELGDAPLAQGAQREQPQAGGFAGGAQQTGCPGQIEH